MSKKKTEEGLDLVGLITDQLNKGVKKGDPKVAFSFTDPDSPQHVKSWIKSGIDVLDIISSNRPEGGMFPCGRVVVLDGVKGSGKSLLALHGAAWAQKAGGHVVYQDAERTVDMDFGRSIGIDFENRFNYTVPKTLEQVWATTEKVIQLMGENREKFKGPVLMVVDSINSIESDAESEADLELVGYNTSNARLNSRALKRIGPMLSECPVPICLVLVRQVRYKLNAKPNEDPYVASGGIGPDFYASLMYRSQPRAKLKYKDEVVGGQIRVKVNKSKFGPSHRYVDVNSYFSRGIDNALTSFDFCKSNKIFGSKTAQTMTFTEESTGSHWEFTKAKFRSLYQEDQELRNSIREAICNHLIRAYDYEVSGDEGIEGLYDQDRKEIENKIETDKKK